jgi:hypothetical protein
VHHEIEPHQNQPPSHVDKLGQTSQPHQQYPEKLLPANPFAVAERTNLFFN